MNSIKQMGDTPENYDKYVDACADACVDAIVTCAIEEWREQQTY